MFIKYIYIIIFKIQIYIQGTFDFGVNEFSDNIGSGIGISIADRVRVFPVSACVLVEVLARIV